MAISVILLSYNSEATIENTLRSALQVSDDVHVVDSYSTDNTLTLCSKHGVNVVQRAFESYGDQRNWAQANLPLRYQWVLHLDADERLSDELIQELQELSGRFPSHLDGFYVAREVRFLGRSIRHGGMFPIWHMRLFRRDRGSCEERRYDQHFYVTGRTRRLRHRMIDDHQMSLSEWTRRHNRWSDEEVKQISISPVGEVIEPKLSGDVVQRKRALRRFYDRAPLFLRVFLLFFYRYVFRLGFLDGKEGLVFFVLHTFWFRFIVDAKLFEQKLLLQRRSGNR